MNQKESFIQEIQSRYSYKNDKIILGKAKLDGEIVEEAEISVALKTMNRHGLIGGATGTGKTKSAQQWSTEWFVWAVAPKTNWPTKHLKLSPRQKCLSSVCPSL